ncbi:hypothetical protein HanPI659440_Chr04g0153281 [Helianthus annuus]|nr:hypothetical protein HanPI659440_Chr04g0153281 [Helianthus annuus]
MTLLLLSKILNFALVSNLLRFFPQFKITYLPPVKNKFMLLPPAKIYEFPLGSKLRYHPQFKIMFLPPVQNKNMVFPS